MFGLKRRDFITLLGGAAAAWPLAARAQQATVPVVGFVRSSSFAEADSIIEGFRQGLKDTGYVDGQNVAINFRSAENRIELLPAIMADLVRVPAAVIVGNTRAALAAKAVTTTLPIVFVTGGDAVDEGFVASLSRPDGNVTGVSFLATALASKRLEILREMVPTAAKIAVLVSSSPEAVSSARQIQAAAPALGLQVIVLNANSGHEIDEAFVTLRRQQVGALVAIGGAFFLSRREQVITLSAHYAIATIYVLREYVTAGGLMSYGPSISDAYRQAGTLTGKLLQGSKPTDLPVQQSVRIELVINLKTAKALGLGIPPTLLARADEVIE